MLRVALVLRSTEVPPVLYDLTYKGTMTNWFLHGGVPVEGPPGPEKAYTPNYWGTRLTLGKRILLYVVLEVLVPQENGF